MDFETTFRTTLWRWDARQADRWFFVSLPEDDSEMLRELPRPPRGFGAIRVEVEIGSSRWATSIFPASTGVYVLPIKAAVRKKESLEEDDELEVTVRVV